MIPAIPPDASAAQLLENSQPEGWEHLGGPMSWFYEIEGSYRDDETYGPSVEVETHGKIGEMVMHFSRHGYFPRRSYLFSGPQGVGKTALIKLMTMTHLAENHEPVAINKEFFADEGAEQDVVLLNADTGEPIMVNPVQNDIVNFSVIQQSFNDTGSVTTDMIEGYNAGSLNKPDIDKIASTINTPLHVMGGRRVIYIAEFDNVSSQQVPSIKDALDPGGAVPQGLLFLADTNHYDKVHKSIGPAGIQRFRTIKFQGWTVQDLTHWIEEYIHAFGIEFDYDSIEQSERINLSSNDTVTSYIAKKSDEAIRNANDIIQQLSTLKRPATAADILDFVENAASSDSPQITRVMSNWRRYVKGKMSTRDFVRQAVDQDASLSGFASYLSIWLIKHTRKETIAKTSSALRQMHKEASYYIPDANTLPLKWSACASSLAEIRDVLNESNRRRR